jgi:hypothetical protein
MLVARGMAKNDVENIDDAIAMLPKLYWSCGRTMIGTESEVEPVGLRNLRISLIGDRAEAVIFDPLLAQSLGWHQVTDDPFSFRSTEKGLMATTRFWRDGWQQEMKHANAFRWAEGQRVELTEAGLAEINRLGGLPPAVTARWRTLEPRQPNPKLSSQWRSDALLPSVPGFQN